MSFLYNRYSDYLRRKYGEKVYKLSVNIPASCPNRNQSGLGGCIYCGESGAVFENFSNNAAVGITEQLNSGKGKIARIYKAKKFIAYFQNFTNTFLPLEKLKSYIEEAAAFPDIVEVAVSTRPDCVSDEYLKAIDKICKSHNLGVSIELGLQSTNAKTLQKINRGHGLAEFIDAVIRVKAHCMEVCTHIILNLPWDTIDDNIQCAKILSALGINQVKIHNLYILKNTVMADMYQNKEFTLITPDEYIERAITFLEYLNPSTAIGRIVGRSPEDSSCFANWGMSWWRIHDEIQSIMKRDNRRQGKLCDYLNGSALRVFQ
ncbi:MAG: TIGR01212 family radical SAM protein [Defluviitaleaceae bacterium]|nr:TIGR01212 family radical SAM protein [Defluviitaleaceae bacterium]